MVVTVHPANVNEDGGLIFASWVSRERARGRARVTPYDSYSENETSNHDDKAK